MLLKKIGMAVFILLVLLSTSLFAGGQQEVQKEETSEESVEGFSWTKYEGVELTLVGRPWLGSWFPWEEFEALTGMKINIDKLGYAQNYQKQMVELGAKSSYFDLYCAQSEAVNVAYSKSNWFEPLDPYIEKGTIPDWSLDSFFAASLGTVTIDGKLIGLPLTIETPLVFNRKDLFADGGIDIPKTLSELENTARKLTTKEGSKPMYGFIGRGTKCLPSFSAVLYNMGGALVDTKEYKVLFDSPESIEAVEFYTRLLREYGPPELAGSSQFGVMPFFEMGNAAMYVDTGAAYSWMVQPDRSNIIGKLSAFELPPGKGGQKPYLSGWNISISPYSKNKEAAWLLMQWITSEKVAKWVAINKGMTPAIKSVYSDSEYVAKTDKNWAQSFMSGLPKSVAGRMRPLILRTREVSDALSAAISKSIEGANVREAVLAAAKEAQKALDKQKEDLGR